MAVKFHIHSRGQFDATHRIGPCVWPHFDLLTIHSGRVWIELLGRDRVEIRQNQSILIYPHTHFVGASIAKRSSASVQHFGVIEPLPGYGMAHPIGRLIGRSKGYELYPPVSARMLRADIYRAIAMAQPRTPSVDPSIREAMLTLILGQLLAEQLRAERQLRPIEETTEFASVMQWASANLHRQLSLDEMAQQAGYSTSYFRAQFAKQIGCSPGAFLRQNRHLEAARLLRETQSPIKEIARRVGYDDIAHFYRFFTKMARLTPQRYRARYQLRG
jgi:AraC-like DNA-binding protein